MNLPATLRRTSFGRLLGSEGAQGETGLNDPARPADAPEQPWGSAPEDRWVRLMPDIATDGVWDVAGCGRSCDELPIAPALVARIRAWQQCYDAWDGLTGAPGKAEDHPDFPHAAFSAEGAAIAAELRAQLPPDWTVRYHDVTRRGGDD